MLLFYLFPRRQKPSSNHPWRVTSGTHRKPEPPKPASKHISSSRTLAANGANDNWFDRARPASLVRSILTFVSQTRSHAPGTGQFVLCLSQHTTTAPRTHRDPSRSSLRCRASGWYWFKVKRGLGVVRDVAACHRLASSLPSLFSHTSQNKQHHCSQMSARVASSSSSSICVLLGDGMDAMGSPGRVKVGASAPMARLAIFGGINKLNSTRPSGRVCEIMVCRWFRPQDGQQSVSGIVE